MSSHCEAWDRDDVVLDGCPEMGEPTFAPPSDVDDRPKVNPGALNRRNFLRRTAETGLALTAADFLGYFLNHGGDPNQGRAWAQSVKAKTKEGATPHYLIYWFIEGGWESYDMFSPVDTPNNILQRLPREKMSEERYRVLNWGKPGYHISKSGNIRYGYLAEGGKSLFPEMAILSSMHTGSFHSGERLKAHMGSYNLRLQGDREADDKSDDHQGGQRLDGGSDVGRRLGAVIDECVIWREQPAGYQGDPASGEQRHPDAS